jgi:hypothetical protein
VNLEFLKKNWQKMGKKIGGMDDFDKMYCDMKLLHLMNGENFPLLEVGHSNEEALRFEKSEEPMLKILKPMCF